jgi:poly(hydroxyalkanoate) depolymerase family esterase
MRLVCAAVLAATTATAEAAMTPVTDFGSNPGALDMFEYVPANLPSGRPLVIVLHGCTQQAASMEPAGWNALADKYQFAVVYAQQRSANQNLSCFTWYDTADISRGAGEAESILEMVDKEIATHKIDAGRVYVTGISAGAAMSAVMLAAYPDRFRAGSIMAGLPYKCATDISTASTCSNNPRTPEQWGDLVRGAFAGFSGTYPRVQIWHGSTDAVVPTANSTELVKQWTNVWKTDPTADGMEMVSNTTHTQYKAGDKVAVDLLASYNSEKGSYRVVVTKLGDCEVKQDPKDEANYEIVETCTDVKASGAVVGVHCDRTRSKELVAKCPWLRRK